jgi:predicted nucleic acid-binding protein
LTAEFVVDASIAVAWVHPAQSTKATENLLLDVEDGVRFAVPQLWFFEVANALLALERRRKLRSEERAMALDLLSALEPVVDDQEHRLAFTRVSALATEVGLSIYDAAYLDLSLRARIPLATKDASLRTIARTAGVVVR